MFERGDKGVRVDDVVGVYAGGGRGERRAACRGVSVQWTVDDVGKIA